MIVHQVKSCSTYLSCRPLRMKTILIVEDNADMRSLLGMLLEAKGYQVTLCSDGQSAEDIALGDFFDVILVDYCMPGRNGLDVTRTARERKLRSCIIGMSLENKKNEFLNAGANAFLAKPFDIGELMRIIESATPSG